MYWWRVDVVLVFFQAPDGPRAAAHAWLDTMSWWSPFRIAVAARLHGQARALLSRGRIDLRWWGCRVPGCGCWTRECDDLRSMAELEWVNAPMTSSPDGQ